MNADTPGRLAGVRDDDDDVVVVLPLFHVFRLSSQLNVCVRFGATMSLVPRFDATKVLEVMQRDGVTVFEGVPTRYVALPNHSAVADYDVSRLRIGVSGSAPLPAEIIHASEKKFGVVILEGYGLTETASTTTFKVSATERKIYSVGKPIGGVEVQIWDDHNRPLPAGPDHVGEIVTLGVNTMRRYFGRRRDCRMTAVQHRNRPGRRDGLGVSELTGTAERKVFTVDPAARRGTKSTNRSAWRMRSCRSTRSWGGGWHARGAGG